MNGECCGSREEGQANDIPATLIVVYYTAGRQFSCNIMPYFGRKLGKMSQNLTSATIVTSAFYKG